MTFNIRTNHTRESGDRFNRDSFAVFWNLSAPVLILVTPLVAFAAYHNYSYFRMEWLAGAGISVMVGLLFGLGITVTSKRARYPIKAILVALLLTYFVDIQFPEVIQSKILFWSIANLCAALTVFFIIGLFLQKHLMQISATVFAVMIATTIIFPPETTPPELGAITSNGTRNKNLPLIVHIVLDGHIGLEGIPPEIEGGKQLKKELKSFYLDNGFYVFGKAFSRHFGTVQSIGHMLNPSIEIGRGIASSRGKWSEWDLVRSEMFSKLEGLGYFFKIYQFGYLNYCTAIKMNLVRCRTSRPNHARTLQTLPIAWTGKLRVLTSLYFSQSLIWRAVRETYRILSKLSSNVGIPLPAWQWERPHVGPLDAFQDIKNLKEDLRFAKGGEYYFAHFNTPHSPYIYGNTCEVDAPKKWANRRNRDWKISFSNSPGQRRHRYVRYFQQVRCLKERIAELLTFMDRSENLKNAIVIIHGDHGSRIVRWEPPGNKKRLIPSDLVDGYSTLFAIKGPDLPPGYDMRIVPIQELFASLVNGGYASLPRTAARIEESTIFLSAGGKPETVPMVNFGDSAGRN